MSFPRPRRRLATLVALLALAGLLATACGSDSNSGADGSTDTTAKRSAFVEIDGVPGVTKDEIRFSAVGTSSNNPSGQCYLDCFLQGAEAYFAYRNAQGGIYGRDLVITDPLDDALGKNQERTLEIISADDTFGVFNVPIIGSGYKALQEKGWPVYTFLVDNPGTQGMDNLFASYSNSCVGPCPRIDYPYPAQALGAEKIAALGFSIAASSQKCAEQVATSFKKYEDVDGAEVVYLNKDLAYGLPNGIAPEVTAMKNAGVDLVFACIDGNTNKALIQEMRRQNLDARVVWYQGDEEFFKENADLVEGSIIGTHLRPFIATETEGQKLYKEWMDKTGAENLTEISMHGWIAADMAFQGLKAAGAPFDRKKVIDATNAIKGYTADGWINARDIGRGHTSPTADDPVTHGEQPHCFSYMEFTGGTYRFLEPLTADKPYACWPGDTYDWSDAVATDPHS
jgi:hypothetical protein